MTTLKNLIDFLDNFAKPCLCCYFIQMKIPMELCMHMKAKCVLEGLVLPIAARCVWSRLKPRWGWVWRCSHVANPHLLQRMLCQAGSVQLWEGGQVREGSRQGGASQDCITVLSVVVSHRAACVKVGAGPDNPCHQQTQWCLLHTWWATAPQAAASCPWECRGAPGTEPAQHILQRGALGNFIYSCWFVQIVWYLCRQFPILHMDKYSSIYESTHWKCDLTCLINIIITVPPTLASVQWSTKRSCMLVSSFVDVWNPSFFHCIALLL